MPQEFLNGTFVSETVYLTVILEYAAILPCFYPA